MTILTPVHKSLFRLVVATYHTPRDVADYLKSLKIGFEARLYFAALTLVFTAILILIISMLMMHIFNGFQMPASGVMVLQSVVFFISIILTVYHGGRLVGGTGSFEQTLLLCSWVQFVTCWVQIVQIIFVSIIMLLPSTAAFSIIALFVSLIVLATLFFVVYVNIVFIMRLHGFRSALKTVLVCLIVSIGLSRIITWLFAFLGLTERMFSYGV